MGFFGWLGEKLGLGVSVDASASESVTLAGSPSVFKTFIDTLLEPDQSEDLVIQTTDGAAMLQLSKVPAGLQVNLARYPFEEHPDRRMEATMVAVPKRGNLLQWAENFNALYRFSEPDAGEIAVFVHDLFAKLYGQPEGYQVSLSSVKFSR